MKLYLCVLLETLLEIVAPRKSIPSMLAAIGVVQRFNGIHNDGQTAEEMTARLVQIKTNAEAIKALASSENRELTETEINSLTVLLDEFDTVKETREQRARIDNMSLDLGATAGRRTTGTDINNRLDGLDLVDPPGGPNGNGVAIVTQNTPPGQWGFNNLGEFAQTVMRAQPGFGGQIDNRLLPIIENDVEHAGIHNAASDTALERIGEEGGFLIPPDFREGINQQTVAEDDLLPRTNPIPVTGNQFTANLDLTTPWQTSGGILAYWEGEGNQMTGSRPKLTPTTVRANKLTALVIATDELLEDAQALGAYIGRKAPEKIAFKESLAVFNGSGAGQPAGILNADSTVSIAKETDQVADTIVYANINNMYNAMYPGYRTNAVWLCNSDITPQLESMTADGASGGHPVFVPGGGTNGATMAPHGTLKGRPIVYSEVCETLGDLGDINFIDFAQYLAIVKSGGIKSDASIHLYFDYGETTFRFTKRVGGQSWWPSAITKRAGGTVAPAVSLAERG